MDRTQTVLIAASVAAELQKAVEAALELALVAKNARVLVLRAGERAAGFKVISNFFNDLAANTISLSHAISLAAIHLSQVIVSEWRAQQFIACLEKSMASLPSSVNALAIVACLDEANVKVIDCNAEFDVLLERINKELGDIHQQMRAADHIILTSRIEAERAGDYRKDLYEMANQVQLRTDAIKSHINQAGQLAGQSWGNE